MAADKKPLNRRLTRLALRDEIERGWKVSVRDPMLGEVIYQFGAWEDDSKTTFKSAGTSTGIRWDRAIWVQKPKGKKVVL